MNRCSLDIDGLSCNVEALLEGGAYISGNTKSQRLTIRRFQTPTNPVQGDVSISMIKS